MNDSTIQLLTIGCAVSAALLIAWFAYTQLGGDNVKLRNRLAGKATTDATDPQSQGLAPLLQKFGEVAAQPFMPKTREGQSDLRRRLGYAGIYAPSAIRMVNGAKTICLAIGLVGGYFLGDALSFIWMGVSVGGLIGFLAPVIWLKMRIKSNQRSLNHGLPDALDLMVVCVEAGLTMDLAMQRVGGELALAHPAVSRELGIAHMETRVGLSRSEALRNLYLRTGNTALQSLSAMLIQAERFGTSIATALRVHADTLRNSRQVAAEEMAAKASVKISFPLVLFIFPSTFIVLAGPTMMKLMNNPMF